MPADPIRFLIVDDIEENLMALEALLRRDGLAIDRAKSADAALELMLRHDYALALLDVHMPGTDGYELAEIMRGTERTRSVPIIFVTASEVNEARRFRGYEAGAVDYIFKPIDPLILKSKAEVFFRIGQQARDLERQRDQMLEIARARDRAMAQLKAHADNSPLALVECDGALVIRRWSQGAERLFGRSAAQMVGLPLPQAGWLSAENIAVLSGWLASAPDPATPPRFATEFTVTQGAGRALECEVYGSVLASAEGAQSLSLQILDITERRQAEEVRSLLIGELNHRIKNTLANVQAIARQSLRQAVDLRSFERSFMGRLQALSRAHSILSDATWASAPLDQLIDDQIRAGTLDGERLHRSGPRVDLSPDTMLRMALILHELGTNAAKYGALSVPEGEVHLSWALAPEGLTLRWEERGGPVVATPDRKGFGMTMIGSSATGDGDWFNTDWRPEGVIWTFGLSRGVTATRSRAMAQTGDCPAAAAGAGALAGRRVLVVEDEPLVALDISFELEDAGAEVVAVARTLSDALDTASRVRCDLALLDGNLNGEPVDRVAALLESRGIPFCFVSGYGREHLPRDFQTVPLVEKPFNPDALRSVLCDIMVMPATVDMPPPGLPA